MLRVEGLSCGCWRAGGEEVGGVGRKLDWVHAVMAMGVRRELEEPSALVEVAARWCQAVQGVAKLDVESKGVLVCKVVLVGGWVADNGVCQDGMNKPIEKLERPLK